MNNPGFYLRMMNHFDRFIVSRLNMTYSRGGTSFRGEVDSLDIIAFS